MSRAIPCAVEVVEPSRTDSVIFVRPRYGIWRVYDAAHLDYLLARGDLDQAKDEMAVEAFLSDLEASRGAQAEPTVGADPESIPAIPTPGSGSLSQRRSWVSSASLFARLPDRSTHAPGAKRGSDSLLRQAAAMDTRAGRWAPAYSPALRALALGALVVVGAGLLATRAVRRGMEGVGR